MNFVTKRSCIKWRSANELPVKSKEQLGTSSNRVGDVQHLHGMWKKTTAFSCEQKMLLEWVCLFLHSNAVFRTVLYSTLAAALASAG